MIDKETRMWLDDLNVATDVAMVIRLTDLPEDFLHTAKTRRERITLLGDYLCGLVRPLVIGVGLGEEALSVMGATGEAIVHGTPRQLRTLLEPDGALARAENLCVLPNHLLSGVVERK